MADALDLKAMLEACSVPARKITIVLKEKATTNALISIFQELGLTSPSTVSSVVKSHIESLIEVAGKMNDCPKARSFLLTYILEGKLGTVQRDLAIKYFKAKKDGPFEVADFEKECGVGVVVSSEEIEKTLKDIMETKKDEIAKEGEKKIIWAEVKKRIPFAPTADVSSVLNLLVQKKKEDHTRADLLSADRFPPVTDNVQLKPELLAEHLKATGGKVVTRFPPEPNGYLHIGHAKSMNLNFGNAKKSGGICIMRFDDTNPATEEQEYIDSILDNVKWMGHQWSKVTYASDYFDQLYLWAIELIKKGKAFVCHQSPKEMEESRETHTNSPYRDRSVDENLRLFEDMKNGKYKEGEATLRMKMNMQSSNSCMWDSVAYRIKYLPHHRTKDKWCIYPSYDFTHCLCDTIENITHSLCTLEFRMRRESYHWLVNELGLYRSHVFEFARLQLTYTILSKRKLIQLVEGKYVSGWDDPRMSTLQGYRRRGYSPDGINALCDDVGVTLHNSTIPIEKLEHFVRMDLNKTSRRIFAVFDPIKVTLRNWDGVLAVKAPNVPNFESLGDHELTFCSPFYIERNDFREEDEEGYFGLALNNSSKYVKLKYANLNIRLVEIKKDALGVPVELIVEHDPLAQCKNAIHWISVVGGEEPLEIEVREYEHLFLSEEPVKKYGKDWLKDLNPNSLAIKKALIDSSVKDLKPFDRVQFERVGFYCCDPDSKDGKFVFNRSVTLKESVWKKQTK